ncbi:MAG: FeoB-associated Cys-rich membrane protein [Bacteroidetes bacterium HGW-Bacteroidetes-6]|jgi:hypothetical protein|nr:MAG: FeoB-associated Cys-rich membrane protein [Bacteroidetes bacterium HGW-Bacteroidetes-6]
MNLQEIIVYIIIGVAVFVALRSIYRQVRHKAPAGACNSCTPGPGCEGCAVKDLMKK